MKKNSNKTKKQKISSQMTAAAEAKENFVFNLGIDLGDKNCEVCVFDRKGESQESFRLPLKAESLRLYLLSIPRSRFAIEAGGQSRWVAELIERLGHQVFVSNGKKVAYTSESDDKHDPGDAYKWASCWRSSRGSCIRFSTGVRKRRRT